MIDITVEALFRKGSRIPFSENVEVCDGVEEFEREGLSDDDHFCRIVKFNWNKKPQIVFVGMDKRTVKDKDSGETPKIFWFLYNNYQDESSIPVRLGITNGITPDDVPAFLKEGLDKNC